MGNLKRRTDSHLSVLVVEDNVSLETSLVRVLRNFDEKPNVSWSTTGEEALQKLQSQKFDLIIVDYTLAGFTNGLYIWEFCKKKCPNTPFILMSGLPVESFLEMTGKLETRPRFLPKPFFTEEFKRMIRESLSLVHS